MKNHPETTEIPVEPATDRLAEIAEQGSDGKGEEESKFQIERVT